MLEPLRAMWRPVARRAARAYVAGPTLEDAVASILRLRRRGLRTTIGYWNRDDDGPGRIAREHAAAIEALSRADPAGCLAVKAPSLDFDSAAVRDILRHARERGIAVHFDALAASSADRTLALLESLRTHHDDLGCTIPGRWRRSLRDADRAIDLGLSVRIVKGQWPESAGDAVDPVRGFLAIVDRVRGRAVKVGVATHDRDLADDALRRLLRAGTACELELLLGLPFSEMVGVADRLGVAIRVYVPYGQAHLPYSVWGAWSEPRLLGRIARDFLRAGERRP